MKKEPNFVDKHVGSRVRMRRMLIGMSQEKLGEALGITFQQIQKYEKGTNRIGASRLQQISSVMSVPVSFFFEGLAATSDQQETSPRQRMCLELARNFAMIDNEKHQEALSQMARALAAQSQAANGGGTDTH